MMSDLSELDLHPSYYRGRNDIAQEFYLPCMSRATQYDRAVGFFSSTIYTIAWPSLKDFVRRNGKMRIICSPVLSPDDITALDEGYQARVLQKSADKLQKEVQDLLNDPYLRKPSCVLASLVALGIIDFRIAFLTSNAGPEQRKLFHDKIGVFTDATRTSVVFKGSMNETWSGLSNDGNLESVDVFVSWGGNRDEMRVWEGIEYFEKLWQDKYPSVIVREFPEVAHEELTNAADAGNWEHIVDDICAGLQVAEERVPYTAGGQGRRLRPHQAQALEEWIQRERRGILEHATGSGKTFTALCAIRDALKRNESPVVLVPSTLLLDQWADELRSTFQDIDIQILLCGGGNDRWRRDSLLRRWTNQSNRPRVVVATMQTASSNEFLTMIQQGEHLFLLADEVHRIGSPGNLKLLSLRSGPRLGLSATPKRAGDPEGTSQIFDYFGGIVPPPFSLGDAIRVGVLTPYMYSVHTVELSESEQREWVQISARINQLYARNVASENISPDVEDRLQLLAIERARIAKTASGKIPLVAQILSEHYKSGQKWIVYCDNQEQLYKILEELREIGIDAREYHSEMRGDREQTLRYFEFNGGVVVSIRCLDEGIDIPSVSHALIVASSKNPREFIQRRGRVLRRSPGKTLAFIHDVVVLPKEICESDELDLRLLESELARAIEFGSGAMNPASIADLQRIAVRFGIDYRNLVDKGLEDDE